MAACGAGPGGAGDCGRDFRSLVQCAVDTLAEAHQREVSCLLQQLEALHAQFQAGGAPEKEPPAELSSNDNHREVGQAGAGGLLMDGCLQRSKLSLGHGVLPLLPEPPGVPAEPPELLEPAPRARSKRSVNVPPLEPVAEEEERVTLRLSDAPSDVENDERPNEAPSAAPLDVGKAWLSISPPLAGAGEGHRGEKPDSPAYESDKSRTGSEPTLGAIDQAHERAHWQWMHRTGWRPYAAAASSKIESAYQGGDSKARLKSGKQGSNPMEIFFADMIQYDASTGNQRDVRRVGPDPWWQRLRREARTYYRSWETGRPRRETFREYMSRADRRRLSLLGASVDGEVVTDEEASTPPNSFSKIARSDTFKTLAVVLVLLNAVWIAIELDLNDQLVLSDADVGFQIMENSFCALFTTEILVRLFAYRTFIAALHDSWFRFDCVLVLLMIFETWLVPLYYLASPEKASTSIGGNFQVLRIARLLRLTRMSRLFKDVPEFITLLKGIVTSSRPVAVTLCLLLILIYIFGIVFRSQVEAGSYLEEKYFSSVMHAMASLLLHGTFLDSVAVVTKEISQEQGFVMFSGLVMACVFMLSIFCTCFTVMNMLIGIVCEMVSVVKQAEEERMAKSMLTSQLKDILMVYDGDDSLSLNKSEFELFMKNAEVRQVLAEYEVDVKGVQTLTEVLFLNDEYIGIHDVDIKLSYDQILELVVRMKGDNTPTVEDIVRLRQYTKHRLDKLQENIMEGQKLMEEHLLREQRQSMWAVETHMMDRLDSLRSRPSMMDRLDSLR